MKVGFIALLIIFSTSASHSAQGDSLWKKARLLCGQKMGRALLGPGEVVADTRGNSASVEMVPTVALLSEQPSNMVQEVATVSQTPRGVNYQPRLELGENEFVAEYHGNEIRRWSLDPKAKYDFRTQITELFRTSKKGEQPTHVFVGVALFPNTSARKYFSTDYYGSYREHFQAEITLRIKDEAEGKQIVSDGSWLQGWTYEIVGKDGFSKFGGPDRGEVTSNSLPPLEGEMFLVLRSPQRPRPVDEKQDIQESLRKDLAYTHEQVSEFLVNNRNRLQIEFKSFSQIEREITAGVDVAREDHFVSFTGNDGVARQIDIYHEALGDFRTLGPVEELDERGRPVFSLGERWFGTIMLAPTKFGEPAQARQVMFDLIPGRFAVFARIASTAEAKRFAEILPNAKVKLFDLGHAGISYQPLLRLSGVGTIVIQIELPIPTDVSPLYTRQRLVADWIVLLKKAMGLSLFSLTSPGIKAR